MKFKNNMRNLSLEKKKSNKENKKSLKIIINSEIIFKRAKNKLKLNSQNKKN